MLAKTFFPTGVLVVRSFSSVASKKLKVGDVLRETRVFSSEDLKAYAEVSHDWNPLHFDPESARKAGFENCLVHGMLVSSMFPRIISAHFPGAVYVSQTLHFRSPVYVGDEILGLVEAKALRETKNKYIVKFSTKCLKENKLVVLDGEATALLPNLEMLQPNILISNNLPVDSLTRFQQYYKERFRLLLSQRKQKRERKMEKRGFAFRSILIHSLWITLTGILLFSLSTSKNHNFGYIRFFSITGTLLITLPWVIQLLVTFVVILLHKTKGYNLMWIVRSPKSEENHQENVTTTTATTNNTTFCSSPLSSLQVLKKDDVDEYEIRIVIGADDPRSPKEGSSARPLEMLKEIEQGRNNTKLLTHGSPVAS